MVGVRLPSELARSLGETKAMACFLVGVGMPLYYWDPGLSPCMLCIPRSRRGSGLSKLSKEEENQNRIKKGKTIDKNIESIGLLRSCIRAQGFGNCVYYQMPRAPIYIDLQIYTKKRSVPRSAIPLRLSSQHIIYMWMPFCLALSKDVNQHSEMLLWT